MHLAGSVVLDVIAASLQFAFSMTNSEYPCHEIALKVVVVVAIAVAVAAAAVVVVVGSR